jgi:hypothetical protein
MASILNIFSDESVKSKKKTNISQSLNQGKKFNKYQNKINNSLEKNALELSGKEGYSNLNNLGLTRETKNVIDKNNYANKQQIINDLRQEYQNTLEQYEELINQTNGNLNGYIDRTNSSNPYLNKVVSFSDGTICYVTNQGVVKVIPSNDIWKTLNIIQTVQVKLNLQWNDSYNTPGTLIPTTPPLVSGIPVKSGQSLGSEGSNVFVSQLLPEVNPTYMDCYAANSTNDNMTFIGGSPPPLTGASIQNGNFSQPVLTNNAYTYITSSSQVPGWYFSNGCLLNNSSAWGYPIPYPGGNQCVSIQNSSYISTQLTLNMGVNYTLTFSACSRNCCNNPNKGNPINIQLYTNSNAYISQIANLTPPVNSWKNYSYIFTVPTSQSYNLYFKGTNTSGDQSTAISNVALNSSSTASGTYSYNSCKQAAITNGYRYFGLQNANTSTNLGYCAVSNSEPAISQYGNSTVPNKMVSLWSSNTSGQTGNTAILTNTGSLQVLNTSGQAVYSSPSSNANPSNYLGCYTDKSTRAMTLYNGGSQQYSNSQCQQIAKQNGYQYYGLQNSTSGTNAQCAVSNNESQSLQYGKATNCTNLSDGSWSGGGWSNAVYSTNNPQSNYFLSLQSDGNMVIYRGTNPNDNQGTIWSTQTNNKQQTSNPNMVSKNGKYGQSWITDGSTLAPGDFIGSDDGTLALIMQTDGNLVLYTYEMQQNCQKMSDGNIGGGVGANAVYDIGKTADPENMGALGYVDSDSNLYTYPSANQQYTNTYPTTINNINATDSGISGANFSNTTVESCKTQCNNNAQCAGFVMNGSNCWLKTNGMYPFGGASSPSQGTTIYIRGKQPTTPPLGVSQNTNIMDSLTYNNYINKGEVGKEYGLAKASTAQKQQLEQLQTKLSLLSNQITNLTNNFQDGTMTAEQQSQENVKGIYNYLTDLTATNNKSKLVAGETSANIQNILKDSDIVVLQKNYDYLFWSILAAGTVLVSMNIVKNQ